MTFEELKSKVDQLKTARDQAVGAIRNIEDGWEKKYGTRDASAVEIKLAGMEKELAELNADYESKMKEAEAILAGV